MTLNVARDKILASMPFGGYFVDGSRLCYERFFPRVFRTPSILKHQNQARRAEKNFLGDHPPLSQGLDDRHPSPPPLSEGLDQPLVYVM